MFDIITTKLHVTLTKLQTTVQVEIVESMNCLEFKNKNKTKITNYTKHTGTVSSKIPVV